VISFTHRVIYYLGNFTHWIEKLAGTRIELGIEKKSKISYLCHESDLDYLAIQPIA
jgi:hypothetical protein